MKIEFVTRMSKEGKITVPERLYKNTLLEGLDLLVTVKPVVVETEKERYDYEKMKKQQLDYLSKDFNPVNLGPRITEEESIYDEMLGGAEKQEYVYDPIDIIVISRGDDNHIYLHFGWKDGESHSITKIKDKHELKNALGGAQYADNFKLTIRSEPLYQELTSIVYHFFNSLSYRLVNTVPLLDDFVDTYEKVKVVVEGRKTNAVVESHHTSIPTIEEKEKEWNEYVKRAQQQDKKDKNNIIETAVKQGLLKPIVNAEDGNIRYEKVDLLSCPKCGIGYDMEYPHKCIKDISIHAICNKGEIKGVILKLDNNGTTLNKDTFVLNTLDQAFEILQDKFLDNNFKLKLSFENAFDRKPFTDEKLRLAINRQVYNFFSRKGFLTSIKEEKDEEESETGSKRVCYIEVQRKLC